MTSCPVTNTGGRLAIEFKCIRCRRRPCGIVAATASAQTSGDWRRAAQNTVLFGSGCSADSHDRAIGSTGVDGAGDHAATIGKTLHQKGHYMALRALTRTRAAFHLSTSTILSLFDADAVLMAFSGTCVHVCTRIVATIRRKRSIPSRATSSLPSETLTEVAAAIVFTGRVTNP